MSLSMLTMADHTALFKETHLINFYATEFRLPGNPVLTRNLYPYPSHWSPMSMMISEGLLVSRVTRNESLVHNEQH